MQTDQLAAERLRTLHEHHLLDTPPEPNFDGIVALAADFLKVPIALFALVDSDRAWFKARIGTPAQELGLDASFCAYATSRDEVLIVEDASQDHRFRRNDLVRGEPHVRFYAGIPVHARNGHALGTLCVFDTKPRVPSAHEKQVLESLARELETQIHLRHLLLEHEKLADERAILTDMILHDAASMVAALRWNFNLLQKELGERSEVLEQSQTAADELLRLCNSVLVAGDGQARSIRAQLAPVHLRSWLDTLARRLGRMYQSEDVAIDLVNELPDQSIDTDVHLLERILINLLKNSVQACSAGGTVRLHARLTKESKLLLTVSDDGPGVPKGLEERVFEPYFSYRTDGDRGTGLGLAFCRLATQALGGSIELKHREPHGAEFLVEVPIT